MYPYGNYALKRLEILFLGWIETLASGLESMGYMRLKRK